MKTGKSYLQWREQRLGFHTKWEEDMLMVAQALSRADVGGIRQHPELLQNVRRCCHINLLSVSGAYRWWDEEFSHLLQAPPFPQ